MMIEKSSVEEEKELEIKESLENEQRIIQEKIEEQKIKETEKIKEQLIQNQKLEATGKKTVFIRKLML